MFNYFFHLFYIIDFFFYVLVRPVTSCIVRVFINNVDRLLTKKLLCVLIMFWSNYFYLIFVTFFFSHSGRHVNSEVGSTFSIEVLMK